jgi:HAD superfamily hydrolase (TIGR01509 family)
MHGMIAPMDRALLFDFGGTLDAPGIAWKERALRLYRDAGIAITREAFEPIFYRADDGLVGALPPGCSLRETLNRLFGAVTDAVQPGDQPLAASISHEFLGEIRRHAAVSAALLARLSRRYRVAVVANFYGNLAAVCDEVGLTAYCDVIVDSAIVGYAKPDRRIFETALATLGVEAGAATFVGDSLPRDMMGARDVGMRHVWLVGSEPPVGSACCPGDVVIRSLPDLEGLLP